MATQKKPTAKTKPKPSQPLPAKAAPLPQSAPAKLKRGNPNWKKGESATPAKLFSKENQPTLQAKTEGRRRQVAGQKLAAQILSGRFRGMKDSDLKKRAAEYYGVSEAEITVEAMLHFRQAEKAIQKADTSAYNAILNRAFGMPKQVNELQFDEGAVVRIGGKKLGE